ncbi:aminopeptidase M1-like isoform X2 [Camellia sinensis]|uniref:aminopeptidase M1-like isoform X2 n=1 Tax=Camellia sinensis TaxID=4442 RepID=UPI0010367712|nr:aminopeptidase M1-like isoform X2 [Camellia sinensis]
MRTLQGHLAIVVTHEVAHQWFGNLVTMEWWTHLWLNEGFATWVSYLVTDTLFLEWEIWTKFLEDTAGVYIWVHWKPHTQLRYCCLKVHHEIQFCPFDVGKHIFGG